MDKIKCEPSCSNRQTAGFERTLITEAILNKKKNAQDEEDAECENTSRLFVAGPQGHKFRQVLIVWPTNEPTGNSIGLVDWSPRGHRLLIAEARWGYNSDFGETTIRIYDAGSGKLTSESFVEDAFRKHAGKDCVGVFGPLDSPRMAELLSAQARISTRAKNSRARTPVWLKGASG